MLPSGYQKCRSTCTRSNLLVERRGYRRSINDRTGTVVPLFFTFKAVFLWTVGTTLRDKRTKECDGNSDDDGGGDDHGDDDGHDVDDGDDDGGNGVVVGCRE